MKLVIVESPSKAKTINKYLGKEYKVLASKGHIVDLPKSKLSIDIENGFKPKYEITNKKSLSEIKKVFKDADELVLAVDLDREGEAIGWHLARELKQVNSKGEKIGKKGLSRIVFSEISEKAIQDAIKKPRSLDMNLVNSQQARRLLDRIVGYKLSPLLWKKIAFGLSAGRVQSVAVRLVVEKELERDAFKSDEYWSVDSFLVAEALSGSSSEFIVESNNSEKLDLSALKGLVFSLSKVNSKKIELKTKDDCKSVLSKIKGGKYIVNDVKSTSQRRSPRAPFITSTLQQVGVNSLGFTAKRTMSAAQKLYESGYITYMRTDSVNMSKDAVSQARSVIKSTLGSKYLSDTVRTYPSKKTAQEAHECIRPVDFSKKSTDLKLEGDLEKVYNIIWQRAIASQMSDAIVESNTIIVNVDSEGEVYEFRTSGKRILFDGFLNVFPESLGEKILPSVAPGQELFSEAVVATQHFTQPPARYSEATLIKKLEELGVGRPSTYASIISTIVQRKYVINENKYLRPTDIGIVVNSLLEKYFYNVVDYGFTAEMESQLDNIAKGKVDWQKMLKDFYFPFEDEVLKNDKNIKREEFTELGKSDKACPECGAGMLIKLGRYGKFLSCSNYPECKGMLSIEEENPTDEQKKLSDLENYESAPVTDDNRPFVLKRGRYGNFWAHPDYPKVKDARPLVMKREFMLDVYGDIPSTEDGRDYLLKKGKFGEFWAHPDYPEKKDIIRIKKKPTL